MARRTALIRKAGPYKVESLANGEIRVCPTWPEYPGYTEHENGPGLFTRMDLAEDLQKWLNSGYEGDLPPLSWERMNQALEEPTP